MLGLILLSPLFLLITVLLKAGSHRPVLHKENRVGRDARIFEVLEFRTTNFDEEQDSWVISIEDDTQPTRFGQMLRALRLDELPQLWNVLRGDMSIVGPRPEIPSYVAAYTRQQLRVLTVRPGIVDLASVRCRHDALVLTHSGDRDEQYRREILPEKVLVNLEYVDRASLRLDLSVMAQTVLRFRRAIRRDL